MLTLVGAGEICAIGMYEHACTLLCLLRDMLLLDGVLDIGCGAA